MKGNSPCKEKLNYPLINFTEFLVLLAQYKKLFIIIFALFTCLSLVATFGWKQKQIISQAIRVGNMAGTPTSDMAQLLFYVRHAQLPLPSNADDVKTARLTKIFNQDLEVLPSNLDVLNNSPYIILKMKVRKNENSLNLFKEITPLILQLIKDFDDGNYQFHTKKAIKNRLVINQKRLALAKKNIEKLSTYPLDTANFQFAFYHIQDQILTLKNEKKYLINRLNEINSAHIFGEIKYENVGANQAEIFFIYLIFSLLLTALIVFLKAMSDHLLLTEHSGE